MLLMLVYILWMFVWKKYVFYWFELLCVWLGMYNLYLFIFYIEDYKSIFYLKIFFIIVEFLLKVRLN